MNKQLSASSRLYKHVIAIVYRCILQAPQLYYSTDRLFKILFVTCYLVVSYFQV